ncbi:MAG: hypothetical protein HF976_11015 [ANME-2 cluster archaeon]|nr:hypothetical protein [ANME-2 cluster archaeon]MBC2701916.1 hypothetical protein [ANME-2 cluster archaeon]MBC2707824.1 hypothetical protein [ANME-2 cluster archaeon]MBC2747855.1 hypothetical protein [ANME-2 cluster archaeon]
MKRTDEPVFTVPGLGKSRPGERQDREVIMILPDGRCVYRFYPGESGMELVEPSNYMNVSVYRHLKRLYYDCEDVDENKFI